MLSTVIFTLLLFSLESGDLISYTWAWIAGIGVGILFA